MVSQFADVRNGFFDFYGKEKRYPICMDEVALAPYNKDLSLDKNMDLFSDLPLRCVTLRNMYYPISNENRKILVTLYKPHRTRLWPFGEMKTIIMLDEGTVCTVSPSEIIDEPE